MALLQQRLHSAPLSSVRPRSLHFATLKSGKRCLSKIGRVSFQSDDKESSTEREEQTLLEKEEGRLHEMSEKQKRTDFKDFSHQEFRKDHYHYYDTTAPRWRTYIPVYSRRREIFIGRIAMVGMFGTCVMEGFLRMGPLKQLSFYTGLPVSSVEIGVLALASYYLLGGLLPGSATFSPANMKDVRKRPPGPPNSLVNPFDLGKVLGISAWGFTKRNELFNGRLAMLGYAAVVRGEIMSGGEGPLAQVADLIGVVPNDFFYMAASYAFVVWLALVISLSSLTGNMGHLPGNGVNEREIH